MFDNYEQKTGTICKFFKDTGNIVIHAYQT